MAKERVQRMLAAILAADVVGYGRLMGTDEAGTRARFNTKLDESCDLPSTNTGTAWSRQWATDF